MREAPIAQRRTQRDEKPSARTRRRTTTCRCSARSRADQPPHDRARWNARGSAPSARALVLAAVCGERELDESSRRRRCARRPPPALHGATASRSPDVARALGGRRRRAPVSPQRRASVASHGERLAGTLRAWQHAADNTSVFVVGVSVASAYSRHDESSTRACPGLFGTRSVADQPVAFAGHCGDPPRGVVLAAASHRAAPGAEGVDARGSNAMLPSRAS